MIMMARRSTTGASVISKTFLNCFSSERAVDIPSKRRQFRDIPVNPSILNYIQTIGVGIPPRRPKKKKKNNKNNNKNNNKLRPRQTRTTSSKLRNGRQPQLPAVVWKPPPLPFGPNAAKVQIVGSVGADNKEKEQTASKFFPTNKFQIPEVALIGRSNVGKSTLLNALLYGNRNEPIKEEVDQKGRRRHRHVEAIKLPKGIKATMSNRPGETKHITFYQLQAKPKPPKTQEPTHNNSSNPCRRLWLVDLPGYGFAYASSQARDAVGKLMTTYLLERSRSSKALKRVLLLIDARHGMKRADLNFLEMLEQQQQQVIGAAAAAKTKKKKSHELPPIQIVLTKCDLVHQTDLARRVVQTRQQLSEALRRETSQLPVMVTSARPGIGFNKNNPEQRKQAGILELQKELAGLATTPTTNTRRANDRSGKN